MLVKIASTKKISSIILVLTLLLLPIMTFISCDKEETKMLVGEIEYVKTYYENHCVYIRPLDQDKMGIWLPIIINSKTETESLFSKNPEEMLELSVGNIVEIVYTVEFPKSNEVHTGKPFYAKTLKVVKNAYVSEKQAIPFKLVEGYEYSIFGEIGKRDFGTVIHIAKISEPEKGYIVYLEDNRCDNGQVLTHYWLDEEALNKSDTSGITITNELKTKITNGETGYKIAVLGIEYYPFEKYDMQSAIYISLYDPAYHW